MGTDVARLFAVVPPSATAGCESRGQLRFSGSAAWRPNVQQPSHADLACPDLPASSPFFLRCTPTLTAVHCLSKVSYFLSSFLSSLLSLHPFSILALLLLLSGQCPNPGPAYPCPVCHKPYSRRQLPPASPPPLHFPPSYPFLSTPLFPDPTPSLLFNPSS